MASKKALSNKAAEATAGMFSNTTADPEPKKAKAAAVAPKKPRKAATSPKVQEESEKAEKKIFSCRLDSDHAAQWQAYIDAIGGKTGDMTDKAIMEYMRRHKLTGDQETIYSLKLKANELSRNVKK